MYSTATGRRIIYMRALEGSGIVQHDDKLIHYYSVLTSAWLVLTRDWSWTKIGPTQGIERF